jgi:hypothetical protein
MNRIILAAALLCALTINAEARHKGAEQACVPTSDVMRPCAYQPSFLAGVKEIRVTMHRERHASNPRPRLARQEVVYANPIQSFSAGVSRPVRYIGGRLICAVNVGSALAERGIKGTGSARALSYLYWGRSAGGPVPGAVIVSSRRGGGHVAIVSRVENGIVFAWNATGGQSGWREIPYRHPVLDYLVPG